MVNRRPSPEQLATQLLEIDQRYKRQARKAVRRNGRSRGMAAIRLSELTRWLDDEYGAGVELPANQRSYMVARIFAHHLGALADGARRIHKWTDVYAPWISPRDLERLITEVEQCPLRWSADTLAWKIRLSDAKRTELKIKTIGAWNFGKDQRKARDKAKRAERERNRRAAKRSKAVPCI